MKNSADTLEIAKPKTKAKITLNAKRKKKLLSKTDLEGQVTVHCMFKSTMYGDKIRIWKSTYLFDRHSSHRSPMVHFENITLFPEWKSIPHGRRIQFTLLFSRLPKQCKVFDLKEIIPEEGGFEARGLRRNKNDVYYVEF